MRQIEMMIMTIAKLLYGKDGGKCDLKEVLERESSAEPRGRLTELLNQGRLGEAEDLLFAQLDEAEDRGTLAAAIDLYRQANALSDEELEAQGFTRSELLEGLGEAAERYGLYIPGIWDEG